MDPKALDKVLNCPSLPSLPGVAISMLELMRQPSCTADKVADLIQNDPALASKVLRTVNSSYYGLSKPCPTISRAVSFLGMNTVKSLTLGLSLVDVGRSTDAGFDLAAYWRRCVYGAAAARIIARHSRMCDPDEVFIGTLLQDVGMLACYAALGVQYAALISSAPAHEDLAPLEREHFGFDHAEAGARMAEKWRLPDHIIACTRFHHRPESAPEVHAPFVRVVSTSTDASACLTDTTVPASLASFRRRMREWFNVDTAASDDLLHQTTGAAKELGKLLELDTGQPPDVGAILAEASEQLLHHQVDMERTQTELTRQTVTDALTGAANRKHFDVSMQRAFSEADQAGTPLSVLFADADKFKSVNDTLGHQAGDAVLVEISRRLREGVGSDGTVCRYGGEEFAIILPGAGLDAARAIAERLRQSLEARPIDIASLGVSAREVRQTISLGVACLSKPASSFANWEALVHAADEAVYAAKKAGRNRVQCAGDATIPAPALAPMPTQRPQSPSAPRTVGDANGKSLILIVEDDALSAKMLDVLLTRHGNFQTVIARSAEDALRLLHGGRKDPAIRPALLLVDLNLPSMSGADFIRACRSMPALCDLRFVVMSACAGADERRDIDSLGALAYLDKADLCSDIVGALKRLTDAARPNAVAA